jgi:hypothetical protein
MNVERNLIPKSGVVLFDDYKSSPMLVFDRGVA